MTTATVRPDLDDEGCREYVEERTRHEAAMSAIPTRERERLVCEFNRHLDRVTEILMNFVRRRSSLPALALLTFGQVVCCSTI
jgi:hypothetical protein